MSTPKIQLLVSDFGEEFDNLNAKLNKVLENQEGISKIIKVTALPTENIDTEALYLCNGEYYKYQEGGNTYLFNEVLTFDGLTVGKEYTGSFKYCENEQEYTSIKYSERYNGVYKLDYEYYTSYPNHTQVYQTDELWGQPKGWGDEAYRTITFSTMPTDEEFIAWRDVNAKPLIQWVKLVAPSDILNITDNGTYDISQYKRVAVSVINGKPIQVVELPNDYKTGAVYLVNESEFVYNGETLVSHLPNFVSQFNGTCYVSGMGAYTSEYVVIIPSVSPNGDSVTSIYDAAFSNRKSLTSVEIGDSVTTIGDTAFSFCTSLASIKIGNSVTFIGNYVFHNCTSLASITFNGTIEQWNAITKSSTWCDKVPATYVQCTDGQVPLTEG